MNGVALHPGADGGFAFWPGRFYRVLCVVNGPAYVEDLEGALAAMGFAPIVSSDPIAWERERPPDWPEERPLPFVAANEALIRMSVGTGVLRAPILLLPDTAMPGANGGPPAHLTVWRAWDYGKAPAVATMAGAAPPQQQAPSAPAKSGNGVALFAAGGLAAVGLWHYMSERRRLKRDETRLHSVEAKAEREEVASAVNRLIAAGYSAPQARAQCAATGLREVSGEDAELVLLGEHSEY